MDYRRILNELQQADVPTGNKESATTVASLPVTLKLAVGDQTELTKFMQVIGKFWSPAKTMSWKDFSHKYGNYSSKEFFQKIGVKYEDLVKALRIPFPNIDVNTVKNLF